MQENRTLADARRAALAEAANICAEAAIRLIGNGKSRVNQVDYHTANVLRSMERRIMELADKEPV